MIRTGICNSENLWDVSCRQQFDVVLPNEQTDKLKAAQKVTAKKRRILQKQKSNKEASKKIKKEGF